MKHLDQKELFKNFPFDVTFQQSNRPSGNMQEGELCFSGKLKLYGFKVKVSVRLNGIASAFSKYCPGSVSDLTILHERLSVQKSRLKKRDDENNNDYLYLSDKIPNSWAAHMDRGYQGAADVMRAPIPREKPLRSVLLQEDVRFNRKLSSDRIILENCLGVSANFWL